MEEKLMPVRRSSSWGVLVASVLLACILAVFMVQGLSAQSTGDGDQPEPEPMATPVEEESQTDDLEASTMPSSTKVLTQSESLTATVTVTSSVSTPNGTISPSKSTTVTLYFPYSCKAFGSIGIGGTRPNSANQWQVYWDDLGEGVSYQIQESRSRSFSTLLKNETITGTSLDVQHDASAFSTYYYRVRAISGCTSPWSEILTVSGAYFDNFSQSNSGWAVRRTTYRERTFAWYGRGAEAGNLIIMVNDRWDWMIASPLMAAPPPPYEIKYRARVHDASNLVSGGAVVGGDWNGDACPEIGNIYRTDNCFNHFYNFNFIHYGAMKLLFEQVDRLRWCPGCGGSQLKRLGDPAYWRTVDPIFGNDSARNWHTYRIVVSNSGLRLYIDGKDRGRFGSSRWVNEPYFGVFASADEYKPSIWFFDYFKVTPIG